MSAHTAPTVTITHDVAVAAQLCDRLIVMERGHIVEEGATTDIIDNPRSPLTESLIARARAMDPLSALTAGRAR